MAQYELTGAALADAATQSALASIIKHPTFAGLVAQHAAAMSAGAASAPMSTGGPGAAYGGAPTVQERGLRDVREFSLGFKQTAIPTGGNYNVTSRPQVIFRGERLVIPSTAAYIGGPATYDAFDVLDIKVGNRSQLVEATGLPGAAFAEQAVGVRLSLDTASIAQDVVISVVNNDVNSATFRAVIFGTAAQ